MENHIETNFREIQKILDSCVSHGYKTGQRNNLRDFIFKHII